MCRTENKSIDTNYGPYTCLMSIEMIYFIYSCWTVYASGNIVMWLKKWYFNVGRIKCFKPGDQNRFNFQKSNTDHFVGLPLKGLNLKIILLPLLDAPKSTVKNRALNFCWLFALICSVRHETQGGGHIQFMKTNHWGFHIQCTSFEHDN